MESLTNGFRAARAVWKPFLALTAIAGAAAIWLFALGSLPGDDASYSPDPATQPFVFVEFGRDADTVWIAAGNDPSQRAQALTIPHAPEYGAFVSLSPDGSRLAYTALAPDTTPDPDAPAGLYVYLLGSENAPELIAEDADLLVKPVWSPDSSHVVFRRSQSAPDRAGDFSLVAIDIGSGAETQIAATTDVALFPVGFSPDGGSLNFVALSPAGSELHAVSPAGGEPRAVARLSDGLTRDWRLSPAGDRLAYLVLQEGEGRYSARIAVAELETGAIVTAAASGRDELGPAWTADGGALAYGVLEPGKGGGIVLHNADGSTTELPAPARGFDMPLAWALDGALLAVQSFDGVSISEPGRAVLALVGRDGARQTVGAAGEVTFVGWLN
jgi:dipeptidyl aminopeptidase/acylaminoacyl peptidase